MSVDAYLSRLPVVISLTKFVHSWCVMMQVWTLTAWALCSWTTSCPCYFPRCVHFLSVSSIMHKINLAIEVICINAFVDRSGTQLQRFSASTSTITMACPRHPMHMFVSGSIRLIIFLNIILRAGPLCSRCGGDAQSNRCFWSGNRPSSEDEMAAVARVLGRPYVHRVITAMMIV